MVSQTIMNCKNKNSAIKNEFVIIRNTEPAFNDIIILLKKSINSGLYYKT